MKQDSILDLMVLDYVVQTLRKDSDTEMLSNQIIALEHSWLSDQMNRPSPLSKSTLETLEKINNLCQSLYSDGCQGLALCMVQMLNCFLSRYIDGLMHSVEAHPVTDKTNPQ